MSEQTYYVPDELTKTFKEARLPEFPYYQSFKHWWNRSVDGIKQNNSTPRAKGWVRGLSELITVKDDLRQRVKAKVKTLRDERANLAGRLENTNTNMPNQLETLWAKPGPAIHWIIAKSNEVLSNKLPDESNVPLSDIELVKHNVDWVERVLTSTENLYAKYLGIARCLSFYWEHNRFCYLEEAHAFKPMVSWNGIQNYTVKELINRGHRDDHAARIRFMYYREEESMTIQQAYDGVEQELQQLSQSTYSLPASTHSFNKTSKEYVNDLRKLQ